jgi:hypothetical protein
MTLNSGLLLGTEYDSLVAALRRDIESERDKAAANPEWEAHHLWNVRLSVRLLEALGHREDELNRPNTKFRGNH